MLGGCAKPGMPTGGQKDVTPPMMLQMSPPSGTLNSNQKDFYIEFDEYVVLKNVENNMLVSPPMKERPEVKTKGRGIKVTIKDSLQPNTTYLFQFKEAVADFNEGNMLPSLEYVFSTGSYIDSMTLGGKVVDALTMEADKDPVAVWLMDEERYQQAVTGFLLNISENDSSSSSPDSSKHAQQDNVTPTANYITRTDKDGTFRFNNIKPGNYRMIAVKDDDKNGAVGVGEAVAFSDSAWAAEVMKMPDSTLKVLDSTLKVQDSGYSYLGNAAKASPKTTPSKPKENAILRMSAKKIEKQRLTSSKFVDAGKVVVTSLLPLKAPKVDAGEEGIVWRMNKTSDTITLWTLNKECDSIAFVVKDTTGIDDTLSLRWHKKRKEKGVGNISIKTGSVTFSTKTLPYYDSLVLVFATPIARQATLKDNNTTTSDSSLAAQDTVKHEEEAMAKARVMLLKDSTVEYCAVKVDSNGLRARLQYSFHQGEKYAVNIDKGLFVDVQGNENDSLNGVITVTKAEDYGNLTVSVVGEIESEAIILELIDDKGKVLCEKRIAEDGKVKFDHIKPAKYRVRAIIDTDGNGKWDEGDFGMQKQPERVIYMDKELDIRANWDFEEKLTIK